MKLVDEQLCKYTKTWSHTVVAMFLLEVIIGNELA